MIRPVGSDSFGTAFTIEVDDRQYLITAKHVVAGLKGEDAVQIRNGDQWSPFKVKVLRCDDPIDIAVLVPPVQLTVTFPLEPTMEGLQFAQDMYFVGFPYGLSTTFPGGFSVALVKKAIFSGERNEKGVDLLFLDGHNNPGFSGGPIVFRDLSRSGATFKVAGVVSGFRHDTTPVLQPVEIKPGEIRPEDIALGRIVEKEGRLFRLRETEQLVRFNTGIVVGYSISHAVDLIRKNPLGPAVSDQIRK